MKFTASNQAWIHGIQSVQNAVGTQLSNNLVENIFISCKENTVVFIATNLNISIRCEIEAHVEQPGEIVIPSKVITRVVRDLNEGDVLFNVENDVIHIKNGEFKIRVKGISADDFPRLNTISEKVMFTLDIAKMKDIIRKTIFASSKEKTRFELDGVCFDIRDKYLNCIATDGRRMVWYRLNDLEIDVEDIGVMVPLKTLQEVYNSMADEGEVTVKLEDRSIEFSCADILIVSNLLTYKFPRYKDIFPKEFNYTALVKKHDIEHSVRRASSLANEKTHMIVVSVEENQINTYSEHLEVGGEGHDRISAEYQGKTVENRYNYQFLLDFFRVIDSEQIEMDLIQSGKPVIFREKDQFDYLYLVMPMKSKNEEEE